MNTNIAASPPTIVQIRRTLTAQHRAKLSRVMRETFARIRIEDPEKARRMICGMNGVVA